MIGKIIGALVGRELDRNNRGSGVGGAAKGVIAASVLRRMGPFGMLLGGGWAAKKAYDRHRANRVGGTIR